VNQMFAPRASEPDTESQLSLAPESGKVTSSATKIREAALQDYAQIAALQKRNGMPAKTQQQWEHLWTDNPVFQRLEKWPIGWVAENEANEVVGYIGNIPLAFHFGGRELLSCCIHAIIVEPRYRGCAGFLLRRMLRQKTPDFILTNTANSNSAKLNDAFRQPRVPTGHWDRSVYWITEYRGFLAGALKNKGLPAVLARPAAALLRLRDRFIKANHWMTSNQGKVQSCTGFDERFDVFWDTLKRTHPERLMADRSRATLQWHFHHPLADGKAWVATVGNGKELAAYAVFLRQDNTEVGLRRVRMVDFQTLNGDVQLLVPLLAWAVNECQKQGIHMLEAFGFRPEKQRVIETVAPYRRTFPWWWYYYQTVNPSLKTPLQNPDAWDPSQYDGDASL